MIEFSLEQPKGGVHFVVPPGASTDTLVSEIHVAGTFILYVCDALSIILRQNVSVLHYL